MSQAEYVHNDYTVGWICPLEIEQIAAELMLDEQHRRLPQPSTDNNSYTLGSINHHHVVVAGLPTTGNCSAATVVSHMRSTFPRLKFTLLVGIGSGVPSRTDAGHIRLGHVVVSKPDGRHSGAIEYDNGKAEADLFYCTGSLAPPPNVLLNAAHHLAVTRARLRKDPIQAHLQRIGTSLCGLRRYRYPGRDNDHLYQSGYTHIDQKRSCQKCGCSPNKMIVRTVREDEDTSDDTEEDHEFIVVHRGTIASGGVTMRNGQQRDELARVYGVVCFEKEAAGALHDFPCLVIRGISDYADSHKNDRWDGYAAAAAAAYARELFFHFPIDEVGYQIRLAQSGKYRRKWQ